MRPSFRPAGDDRAGELPDLGQDLSLIHISLKVRRARVMGQIRPGIPVWQTGAESRFPGIPYVIFPGNVGEDTTLREAAEILMKSR